MSLIRSVLKQTRQEIRRGRAKIDMRALNSFFLSDNCLRVICRVFHVVYPEIFNSPLEGLLRVLQTQAILLLKSLSDPTFSGIDFKKKMGPNYPYEYVILRRKK